MSQVIPLIGDFSARQYQRWQRELQRLLPDEQIVAFNELTDTQKRQAEVAIVANPDPAELAQLSNLVWVQSLWAGVEKILPLFQHASAKLVRLIDPALADAMSEAVLTWCLYLHRNMHTYRQQQQQIVWHQHDYLPASERRIGVLGLGELGTACALRLANNGFAVSGWSRQAKQLAGVECLYGEKGLNQLLKQCDIVVCLLPLTEQTQKLLNGARLALLKPEASLINFARGAIIDDDALLTQLAAQPQQHAVLDVFSCEPLPAEHPYWQHPQVTVLPHISAPTRLDTACAIVATNIQTYREQGYLPTTVDLQRGY